MGGTMPKQIDASVLEVALRGYRAELQRIADKITAIRKDLVVRASSAPTLTDRARTRHTDPAKPKRGMSSAGRKHIAEAQRKRWAAYHAEHNAPARKAAFKPKLSPARRAALATTLAKVRAARVAKKAAAA